MIFGDGHGTICKKCGKIKLVPGRGLPTFIGGSCKCKRITNNQFRPLTPQTLPQTITSTFIAEEPVDDQTRRDIIKLVNKIYAENRDLKAELKKQKSDTEIERPKTRGHSHDFQIIDNTFICMICGFQVKKKDVGRTYPLRSPYPNNNYPRGVRWQK